MRICCRCFNKDGKPVKAVTEAVFSSTQERYDLCQSCNEIVREFINNPTESFKCELCPFESKSEQGLKVHMKVKHGTK